MRKCVRHIKIISPSFFSPFSKYGVHSWNKKIEQHTKLDNVAEGPDEAVTINGVITVVDGTPDPDLVFFRSQETGFACRQTGATLMGQTLMSDAMGW